LSGESPQALVKLLDTGDWFPTRPTARCSLSICHSERSEESRSSGLFEGL